MNPSLIHLGLVLVAEVSPLSVTELLSDRDRFHGQPVTVSGTISNFREGFTHGPTRHYTFKFSDGVETVLVISFATPPCWSGAATVEGTFEGDIPIYEDRAGRRDEVQAPVSERGPIRDFHIKRRFRKSSLRRSAGIRALTHAKAYEPDTVNGKVTPDTAYSVPSTRCCSRTTATLTKHSALAGEQFLEARIRTEPNCGNEDVERAGNQRLNEREDDRHSIESHRNFSLDVLTERFRKQGVVAVCAQQHTSQDVVGAGSPRAGRCHRRRPAASRSGWCPSNQ